MSTPAFAVVALAVGLSMDAMAVAATKGFRAPTLRARDVSKLALIFGAFQGGMPVLGWAIGARFAKVIEDWDHWVAFALLGGIGLKMIYDARRHAQDEQQDARARFGWWPLVVLGIATSVDALVAGLTLPLLGVPIWIAAGTIGATTALLSAAGVYLGRHFGARVGRKLDVFGGVLLIGLATKILIEHLSSS